MYRTAVRLGLSGTVANSNTGVVIHVQGRRRLDLVRALQEHPPRLAQISRIVVRPAPLASVSDFRIVPSVSTGHLATYAAPDLATCSACRREIANPRARRYRYPFTNCTECGPRYSIITGLPYDRHQTTMRVFEMCRECQREYNSPSDRRFHAQPIACPRCGPTLALKSSENSNQTLARGNDSLELAARAIVKGQVLLVKGIGGYHLMCDAGMDAPVRQIRKCKSRDTKPLAIMCPNIAAARRLCRLTGPEAALLCSRAAPIVLLPKRTKPKARLSNLVAPANNYLGVMLPYTPLHHLLFRALNRLGWQGSALAATSANRHDEPIVITETELRTIPCPALVLTHNRPIANRCDDSVVTMPSPRLAPVIIRRARGFVPDPVLLAPMFHVKHPVLAAGADHHGALLLAVNGRAWFSPHIGTPAPGAGEEFFLDALRRLEMMTGVRPELVACDLHPDYWSSRLAEKLATERRLPLVRVQHHFAHALSAAAESVPTTGCHNKSERTLALVCDGTGLGIDGHIWGCELLLIEPNLSWSRVGHMREVMLSGSISELPDPSLIAAEWLEQLGMSRERKALGLPKPPVEGRRTPTSSLGRLFDAAAAITGVCRKATFSGEAAVALEAAACQGLSMLRYASAQLSTPREPHHPPMTHEIDPEPVLRQLTRAAMAGIQPPLVALWFHEYVGTLLSRAVQHWTRCYRVSSLVLSGGSFQNRLLLNKLLRLKGVRVLLNHASPPGDGGLALGQAIAAARL